MPRTFIIAEIGVNHDGSPMRAFELIRAARDAGADAVKFQLFRDRPEIEHLRFPSGTMPAFRVYADSAGVEFMCSPFYLEAVAAVDPLVRRHKVASGFLTDRAMLDAVCATGKPVIVSTGMASMADVRKAVRGRDNISLLHCVSSYPCPDEDANLDAITYLREQFDLPVGYSDHTAGILAPVAAVALGAIIIEKHLTWSKDAIGPDHACSAEPDEFADMVRQIRRVETMLGDGMKRVMPSEAECAAVWRAA